MTLNDVIDRREQLEGEITRAIAAFEKETGCHVTQVTVWRTDTAALHDSRKQSHLSRLVAEVVLP